MIDYRTMDMVDMNLKKLIVVVDIMRLAFEIVAVLKRVDKK